MKTKLIALLLLGLASASAFAHGDHDDGKAAKITGPNKGRVIAGGQSPLELFVTAERKVRLTFLDEAGKPAPVGTQVVTLVTGTRAAPVTLEFAADGDGLLSTVALPEGVNLPAIVRIAPAPGAQATTVRLQLNLAQCGECDRAEYACACDH